MSISDPGNAGSLVAARKERLQRLGHDFVVAESSGAYILSEDGRRFLDGICNAGSCNLGHRLSELIEELRRALRETDQGNFPLMSGEKALLAAALAEFVPGPLECAIFSVTRGEAMDAACKIARGATQRRELVTVDGGWHGQTGFALSLSERPDADCYAPLIPGIAKVPFGDLSAAEKAINKDTAAFVLEPIQAENGCRRTSPEYLRGLETLCRERGALLLLDETQSGFGRTGRRFAFEAFGVSPDILVLGEALGAGMFPIAATLLTQRVNRFMNEHPLIHISTFGGSDVGCRVALKALECYRRTEPWKNAASLGEKIIAGLSADCDAPLFDKDHVRGAGLLISIDLDTPERAAALCKLAAERGLLVLPGAVARHTVVLRPSLTIGESEAKWIVQVMGECAAALPVDSDLP